MSLRIAIGAFAGPYGGYGNESRSPGVLGMGEG